MVDTLSETGGTFAMGYVDARFLKLISDQYKDIKEGHYLYPLYDVRHFALAAAIDTLPESAARNELYQRLIDSGTTALVARLATRLDNKNIHDEVSQAIAELMPGVQTILQKDRSYADKQLAAELDTVAQKIGQLRKSEAPLSAQDILQEFGLSLDHVAVPYRIDSIDYDIAEHRKKLYDTAEKVLRDKDGHILTNKTLYVIGGTDTQTAYAGLLARELMADGLITQENSNKVIFLSSMLSFGPENIEADKTKYPQHIGRLLKAAVKVGQQKNLPGAFILSAADEDVSRITVHNALDTEKISSSIPDAFRSLHPVGTVTPEKGFVLGSAPHLIKPWRNKALNAPLPELPPIAMPLISGNNTSTILAALRNMPDTPVMIEGGIPTRQIPISRRVHATYSLERYDGESISNYRDKDHPHIINVPMREDVAIPASKIWVNPIVPLKSAALEGDDSGWITQDFIMSPSTRIIHSQDVDAIKNIIRERAEHGVPTYYVNSIAYNAGANPGHERMEPLIPVKAWQESGFIADVKAAGGIVLENTTLVGAYLDAMLALSAVENLHGSEKIRALTKTDITRELNLSIPKIADAEPQTEDEPSAWSPKPLVKAIGLHYVPFSAAVNGTLKVAAAGNQAVVLNSLPGEALPARHVSIVADHPGAEFTSAFTYNNAIHVRDRNMRIEGDRPSGDYAAAQAFFNAGVKSGGNKTAREILYKKEGVSLDDLPERNATRAGK